MKRTILFLFTLLTSIAINAEYFCATSENHFENHLHYRAPSYVHYEGPYHVRVYFHIIRKTDGTGEYSFSASDIPVCIQRLDSDFASFNIVFDNSGMDYIDNTYYYSKPKLSESEYSSLINTNDHYNAIDIYLLPTNVMGAGIASGIPGRALVIGGMENGIPLGSSVVLSHEMGHCMGLYHTFYTGSCPELVNGSNCDICGDYICDTPADPGHLSYNINDNCEWTGTETDANGQLYSPDPKLIMSSSNVSCMQYFSAGQGERMINYLLSDPILENRVTPSVAYLQNGRISFESIFVYDSIIVGRNVTSAPVGDVEVLAGGGMGLIAGKKIILKPGFKVNAGAEFFTYVGSDFLSLRSNARRHRSENVYHPLLENTSWTSFWYDFEDPDYVVVFDVIGDTLVDEKKLIIIKEKNIDVYWYDMGSSVVTPKQRIWYLYEDLENRRVYAANEAKVGTLMYDFSLQIGDSFPLDSSYTLTEISTINNSGYERKKYTFTTSNGAYSITWIEGLGNYYSPLWPACFNRTGNPSRVLCVKKGDEIVYDTGDFYGVSCESVEKILDNNITEATEQPKKISSLISAIKILRDGQLLIQRDGKTYTVQGVEMK